MKITKQPGCQTVCKALERRGATVVETAIVMLPLLMFIIGIFEYGRILMVRNLVENACREGARYAVVHAYDKTTADIQQVVYNSLAGQSNNFLDTGMATFTKDDVLVFKSDATTGASNGVWSDAKFGEPITVQIRGNIVIAVPRILNTPTTMPFVAQSTMLSEAN